MPLVVAMPTMATMLEGGYARWREEVLAEAGRQGVDVEGLLDDPISPC